MSELALLAPHPIRSQKPEKEWLSRKEAATYLEKIGCPVSARALEQRAANNNAGKGPPLIEGVNFLQKPYPSGRLAQTVRNRLDRD